MIILTTAKKNDDGFKKPNFPTLPASVGENPFAGKKFTAGDKKFYSFEEGTVDFGEYDEEEEYPNYQYAYTYDAEKKLIFMKIIKINMYDNLLGWDECVKCIKEMYTIEALKKSYSAGTLEDLQEEFDKEGIPYETTDTKEDLIDKIVKLLIDDMKEYYCLPKDTSDEKVLKTVIEDDINDMRKEYERLYIYSYELENDTLTLKKELADDFKLEGLTDYYELQSIYRKSGILNITFYYNGSFTIEIDEVPYQYNITEITSDKIKGTIIDEDSDAPTNIEVGYKTEGKGSDIKVTFTYEDVSGEYEYYSYQDEYSLKK